MFIVFNGKMWIEYNIFLNGNIGIGLPQDVINFLSLYTLKIIVAYIIYLVVIKPIVNKISVEIRVRLQKDIFPICCTVYDISDIFFQGIIFIKVLQDFFECIKGETVMYGENSVIYIVIAIGQVYSWVSRIYKQNSSIWYNNCIMYTDYFDSNGKRIATKDKVVYRNKIHKIYNNKGVWYLGDACREKDIKLEDAVMDQKGNLRVYFWGMGEENNKY